MTAEETSPDIAERADESGWLDVDGFRVRWFAWGTGEPALVLAHGGGAHSGWWLELVDSLNVDGMNTEQRVISIDFTGSGDSDRRDAYTFAGWARELEVAIRELAGGRAVIVAHSMGGRASVVCAALHPELVEALVLFDSIIPTRNDEPFPPSKPLRVYSTRQEALDRFRLVPGGESQDPAAVQRLAEYSVTEVDGGWSWKFDPRIFEVSDDVIVNALLPSIACPVFVVHGGISPHTYDDMVDDLEAALGRSVPYVKLAGADHHFMVDRPQDAVRVLAEIAETRPRRH
jgi:pimeloyl-ACP methyl ester carboxylesterase